MSDALSTDRVVSVSPRHTTESFEDARQRELFLAPRIVDQQVADDLTGSLRALIDHAASAARALETQLGRLDQAETRAAEAATRLEDRLRLGARMLKAFGVQIDRVEAAVAAVGERRADAPAAAQRRATRSRRVLDELRKRIEALSRQALDELEQRLRCHRDDLGGVDERVVELSARIDTLMNLVERAEVDIAVLASKCPADPPTSSPPPENESGDRHAQKLLEATEQLSAAMRESAKRLEKSIGKRTSKPSSAASRSSARATESPAGGRARKPRARNTG
ncbi:MAG: hypothetical protein ACYSTY_05935 [Planctomycetota bacterium]